MPRPAADEYASFVGAYISLVDSEDIGATLESQLSQTLRLLGGVGGERALYRYEAGKWSVKEVVGHMSDTERVFSYRMLRVGRGDATPLPGFEQDDFVRGASFDSIPWEELVAEFEAVRRATLHLCRQFAPEAWLRRGTVNNAGISARALAYAIAGHELHHRGILTKSYSLA